MEEITELMETLHKEQKKFGHEIYILRMKLAKFYETENISKDMIVEALEEKPSSASGYETIIVEWDGDPAFYSELEEIIIEIEKGI